VKPNIFLSLLHYVYGGKLTNSNLKENAKDLINAADKFGVVNLKLEAEVCYVKSTALTIDNILDNLLYADSKNCALHFVVENGEDILLDKVSFDNVPGSIVTDVLTAVARGKRNDDDDASGSDASNNNNLNTMRVGTLRNMIRDKGLEVDGTRESMIALLKENS